MERQDFGTVGWEQPVALPRTLDGESLNLKTVEESGQVLVA